MGVGMHIIQVKVAYDGQLAQMWGAFYVIYPPVYQIIPKEVEVPIYYPVVKPSPPAVIKLGVEYREEYLLSEGQSLLIPIIVKNLGNVNLHNLRISLSHRRFSKIFV